MSTPEDPNRREQPPGEPLPGAGTTGPGEGAPAGAPAPQSPGPQPPGPQSPPPGQAPPYGGAEPPGGWSGAAPAAFGARYADYGKRVAAYILDGIIVTVPAILIIALAGVGIAGADSDGGIGAAIGGAILGFIVFSIIALLYAPLLMMRDGEHNGQTLGKQVMGIRVVRTDGRPMDFMWSALREVIVKGLAVGIASSIIPLIPWLADMLWPLWDDESRALHDMAVSTRVVEA